MSRVVSRFFAATAFALLPITQTFAQNAEKVELPHDARIESVSIPKGNGKGVCGQQAILNAVHRNSKVIGTVLGFDIFTLSKSNPSDPENAPLLVVELTGLYNAEVAYGNGNQIPGAIAEINQAFGDNVARRAVSQDYQDPRLLEKANAAFIIPASFADKHPSGSNHCSNLLSSIEVRESRFDF